MTLARKTWRIAGVDFDHMHMGDLLAMAKNHPNVQIVGVSDDQPERALGVLDGVGLDRNLFEPDYRKLLEKTRPDIVILCPATARHADWVERVAPFGTHILVEKPFAASVAEADRMIAAVTKTGKQLAINWPLRWVAAHVTAKRLIDQGLIGELIQIHYHDGNRGPLRHLAGKVAVPEEIANTHKAKSWWYSPDAGGGSLLDYLGYGTTLGAWFMNGRCPVEVTAMVDSPEGLAVDEHSISICRYDIPNSGLSKFETRWGTFTDPWIAQPQPRTGFVLVGRSGTIASYDYAKTVRVQTRQQEAGEEIPVDELKPPLNNPINYLIHCLETGAAIEGPLSPKTARIGQQIVDAARRSAREKRTVNVV
jgi:glucose-fructose oxidoreductase